MARRKKKLSPIYVVSLGVHLAIGAALAFVPQERLREVVAIALNEAPKPQAKPEPPKPPPRAAEPPARVAHARRAEHSNALPPSAAEASAAPAFTDLGLTLDSSSSDGLAVNIAAPPPRPVTPPPAAIVTKPKLLTAHRAQATCGESLIKARPLALVRPSYTDDARRARVEGRIRIELMVDENGEVSAARVLDGLGHGLDEAAIAAAKRLRFAAATQCGRAVSALFVIAMRFQLGT